METRRTRSCTAVKKRNQKEVYLRIVVKKKKRMSAEITISENYETLSNKKNTWKKKELVDNPLVNPDINLI